MKTDLLAPAESSAKKKSGGLYRACISTKTTLVFLFVFAALYFIGTVFPQSADPDRLEQYRQAGGKLALVVGALDLLNLFHSWYFLLLAGLFALHLLLCSLHRLNIIRRRPKFGLFTRDELLQRENGFSFTCPGGDVDIEQGLRKLGLNRIRYYSENAQAKRVVAEKGKPFRWFSLLYHLCILLAIAGFVVTSLFAFEDYITLSVGETKPLLLESQPTTWRQITSALGMKGKKRVAPLKLELSEFVTKYTEKPRLQYPETALERLLSVWGTGQRPRYSLPKNAIVPLDWFSMLKLYRDNWPVKEKTIEVNDPLRYAGITFYQVGYEYGFDLQVGDESLSNLVCEQPFTIPQMEGQFLLETPRMGTVRKYGGGIGIIAPAAKLKYRPPSPANARWAVVAELAPNQPAEVMHTQMTISNLKTSSVLSYRYDPGVRILWLATILLLIFMALRIYAPWYQVHCYAETAGDRTLVTCSIRMMGLFARPERLKDRIIRDLPSV